MMATAARPKRMENSFQRIQETYPVVPGRTFTAAGVYDKTGILVVLALITGLVSYLANFGWVAIIGAALVGFVLAMVGIYKPATAKFVAPLYALVEGIALGGITAAYATTSGSGIVPLAIIFTGGIFLGALVVFRSGLVKITPKFASMTLMALIGFLLVGIALALGLPVPGLSNSSTLLIFGVFGVIIGVACLFMDFNYIQIGEQRHLPAEGEWSGALMLMVSLVFVYLNVLRILGRRR
jgi:uncharacterized YccA/Bax inhibitor family protein